MFVWTPMLQLTLPSRFSHAGPDVRLLDPPEHVPDSEVPGNHRRLDFPRREPHAGPESRQEVRLLVQILPRESSLIPGGGAGPRPPEPRINQGPLVLLAPAVKLRQQDPQLLVI